MKQIKKIITLLVLVGFSLTPLLWFMGKGNVLINGIDTNFPLNPAMWFIRRLYVWTNFPNAGIDFSSSTAGLFFHLVQVIPSKLGLNIQQVQVVSLIFWFMLIVFSSYFLAKLLFKNNTLVQLLFVSLYSFNIYLFNTWENVKVANLSLVASIPLGVAVFILLRSGRLSYVKGMFFSSVIGVILSGAGINPSYFICFFLILLIIAFFQSLVDLKIKSIFKAFGNFLIISIPIVLINFFWILPTANFILENIKPTGSLFSIGFTNWVDSLSANTSLLNIFRLQGAWDWYAFDGVSGLPIYIPYALNYFYRLPFVVFSFLSLTLTLLALFLVAHLKNKITRADLGLYLAFSIMMIVGVFLGVGTYLPTGAAFRWLSDHIPFFTIFRSPWYIFTPLVTLSMSALSCVFFYKSLKVFPKEKVMLKLAGNVVILTIIIGNLFYCYPLVTGKIYRPDKEDSFFVEFPSYTFETQDWLENKKGIRVVNYPDDEIEKFSWGYRGIESILGLFSDTEVIFSPLNSPDSNIAILIKEFYKNIKRGEIDAATSIAQKLNIGLIFEKGDQTSLSRSLPRKIIESEAASFGDWKFYNFPEIPTPKIYSPSSIFLGREGKEGISGVSVLPNNGVLLNIDDTVVKSIDFIKDYFGFILPARNSQEDELKSLVYSESRLDNRLVSRDLSKVEFIVDMPNDGEYSPIIQRYNLENFGISLEQPMEVEVDGEKSIWETDSYSDSYLRFKSVALIRGTHKITIRLKNDNLVSGGDFSFGKTFKEGGYGEGRGEYTIVEDLLGKHLQIFNVGKANVSADFSVSTFDPFTSYYVELKYRQIYGNNANVVVLQGNDNSLVKAQTERLPNYPEWHKFSFYYEPVQTSSHAFVSLLAPFTSDPLGTKIVYDDLQVYKVFTNKLVFLQESSSPITNFPKIEFDKKSPVAYVGRVTEANSPHILVFSENYSPEWDLVILDAKGNEVKKKYSHFSSNLYANTWLVDNSPQSYNFKISYTPQNLFWLGLAISSLTFLLLSSLFVYQLTNNKNIHE